MLAFITASCQVTNSDSRALSQRALEPIVDATDEFPIRLPQSLIGGTLAEDHQFPATVGLLYRVQDDGTPDHLTCTMTKISPTKFLTAAHYNASM